MTSLTECPLCSRSFASNRIETHAATCDGSAPPSSSSRPRNVVSMLLGSSQKRVKSDHDLVVLDEDTVKNVKESGTELDFKQDQDLRPSAFDLLMSKRKSLNETTNSNKADQHVEDEDEMRPHTSRIAGPSALSMLMSASVERSKPECMTFDSITGKCEWTENIPPETEGQWRAWVKIGKGTYQTKLLLVGTNVPSAEAPLKCENVCRLTVGTLKSVMQKAYRRRDSVTCLRATCELAIKSWRDLVRRVPIVVLEDGVASASFPGLVWIMLADSVGLLPSRTLLNFILQAVASGSQTKLLDSSDMASNNVVATRQELRSMKSGEDAALVYSITARSNFGGMGGDVMMCKRFSRLWFERLVSTDGDKWSHVLHSSQLSRGDMRIQGFISNPVPFPPLAAIDSHCQPSLFTQIAKKFSVAEDDVRHAMWHFRGSLNFRQPITSLKDVLTEPTELLLETIKEQKLRLERGIFDLPGGDEQTERVQRVWQTVLEECEAISKSFLVDMLQPQQW